MDEYREMIILQKSRGKKDGEVHNNKTIMHTKNKIMSLSGKSVVLSTCMHSRQVNVSSVVFLIET